MMNPDYYSLTKLSVELSDTCVDKTNEQAVFSSEDDNDTKELKEIRANLRSKYLKTLSSLMGMENCEFTTCENTVVNGDFKAIDAQSSMIGVSRLKTNLGIIPNALLRVSDLYYIHFPVKKQIK